MISVTPPPKNYKISSAFSYNFKSALTLDLTSVAYAIEGNKNLIYALEQSLNGLQNIKVIAQTDQVDVLLNYFPLFFDGQEPVSKLIPALSGLGEDEPEKSNLEKITSSDGASFDTFLSTFKHRLIGHSYFKESSRLYWL